MAEMLELARPLIQAPGTVTVDQFRHHLGGGTLSEVASVLRAAKMEAGLLPWSPDTVPASLRPLVMRSESAVPMDRAAILADRIIDALDPVAPLLASTRAALEHALELVSAAARTQIADAQAEAERTSLDAWRTSQEVLDAVRVVEQERDDARLHLLDAEYRQTVRYDLLRAECDDLRRSLAFETDRIRSMQGALDEAHEELTRVSSSATTMTDTIARLTDQLHQVSLRAAVAEARLAQLPTMERQLADATTALGVARETAAHHAAENASRREALLIVSQETAYLRESMERAQRAATDAAKAAGAHERELELRRAADTDAQPS